MRPSEIQLQLGNFPLMLSLTHAFTQTFSPSSITPVDEACSERAGPSVGGALEMN
jgi:hypothetical protein